MSPETEAARKKKDQKTASKHVLNTKDAKKLTKAHELLGDDKWDAAKLILVPSWFHDSLFTIGGRFGIKVTPYHAMIWGVTLVSMAALFLVVMKTKMGMAMRACAQNPTAASLMGIQLNRVVAVTFFIAVRLFRWE